MSGEKRVKYDLTKESADYGQSSDDEEIAEKSEKRRKRRDLTEKFRPSGSKAVIPPEGGGNGGGRNKYLEMNVYAKHKHLINHYELSYKGATEKLNRDSSKDKRDIDVIKEHHQFIWDDVKEEDSNNLSWETNLALKYWRRLFKEYAICDLSRYKENKVAMRWRIEKEVKDGKGQFNCGNKKCNLDVELKTWEVNFAYVEKEERKNALVKIRLCPECSYKLNYHHKNKEVTKSSRKKKKKKKGKKKRKRSSSSSSSSSSEDDDEDKKIEQIVAKEKRDEKSASEIWSAPINAEKEQKNGEDFSEFLDELFL